MANPRTIQVGGVTFTIHNEMTSAVDTTPTYRYATIKSGRVWPPEWTYGMNADGLDVSCGLFTTTARVSAQAANPAELQRWSAGYLQNIDVMNRSATYIPGNIVINELLQSAPAFPIHDGEGGEFPFDPTPAYPFVQNNDVLTVTESDDPHQQFPMSLGSQPEYTVNNRALNGNLNSTAGTIDFTIWFALARAPANDPNPPDPNNNQPCLVLVNSQTWRQDFTTTKNQNGTFTLPPALAATGAVQNLQQVVYQFQPPAANFPDVREEAAANDQIYFQFNYPGVNGPIRWGVNDEGDAALFVAQNQIPSVPNFFQP